MQSLSGVAAGSYTLKVKVTDLTVEGGTVEFTIQVLQAATLTIGEDTTYLNVARKGSPTGDDLALPVTFASGGNAVTSLSFAVKYNTTCLTFTGGGTESTPGTISVGPLSNPTTATTVATLNFKAKTTAQGCVGLRNDVNIDLDSANVDVSGVPLAAIFNHNQIIVIENSARGDCNADVKVNAGDFPAIILETFDADDSGNTTLLGARAWLEAPYSTFLGSAYGCDANATGAVDVADVLCTVNTVFNNYAACSAGTVKAASVAPASLGAAAALQADGTVILPIAIAGNGNQVGGIGFSLFLDPTKVQFDPTDADADGLPDAVTVNVQGNLIKMAQWDVETHMLQVAVAGISLPLSPFGDGPVVTLALKSVDGSAPVLNVVSATAGDVNGFDVPVQIEGRDPIVEMIKLFLPAISNQ